MPFFIIRCVHKICANGIACNRFILAFGLVVIGFTNANWYAQLRYSKVMITEILEGPYSINNIDLYSNYSGNNIVSLNLSFLVLTCKAILWQNQIYLIIKNHAQCSLWICVTVWICVVFLRFASSYSVFQLGNELVSLQLCLGFSSQRTSLHCTIIEATLYTTSGQEMRVCLSTQKYRCVCQVIPPTV